jgi:hypothetical protein
MTDDDLALAWENFATALADVPRQREHRRRAANMLRGVSLADIGFNQGQQQAAQYQAMSLNAASRHSQYRGIKGGLFGFGIMI